MLEEGLKKFRVKETFEVTRWTYVNAENKEDAIRMLENGEGIEGADISDEWKDVDWKSVEQVVNVNPGLKEYLGKSE